MPKYATTFLLIVIVLIYDISSWTQENISVTTERGNKILVALEKYRNSNGEYPSKLKSLTPDYVIEIPLPSVGTKKWDYQLENKGFYLGVNGNDLDEDPVLYITNSSSVWFMDTR